MQYFKGDATELKFIASGTPIDDALSLQKQHFFEDCFECFILGEMLYDNNLSPLANAIPREIFRETFFTVFESFLVAGSFESYLTVFRKIFGDDVEVEFTVPGPGRLEIEITAAGVELSIFAARNIESNQYVYNDVEVVDNPPIDPPDLLAFQTIKGFTSQYELEQMLYEMVPAGIYTVITLNLA